MAGRSRVELTTMTELGFWKWAAAEPDRVAIIDPAGTQTTYGELAGLANALARGLQGAGARYESSIACLLPNSLEFLAVFLAAFQSGLYVVYLNYHLRPDEVAYVLGDSEAAVFIASARYADAAAMAANAARIPVGSRFAVGEVDASFRPFDTLVRGMSRDLPPLRRPGDRMQYTSGTTGKPKGVRRPLDPGSVDEVASRLGTGQLLGLEPGRGIHLAAGPLYHSAPMSITIQALHFGNTVVLMDGWDAERTLRLIETYRVTHSHMVPTMFHRLLALPDQVRRRYDLSSLRTVAHGAAPIAVETKRQMIEWWGPILYEYFGSTEISGTGVTSVDWLAHVGTVGKPWPGVELKIVDDQGAECPPNRQGQIFMRSPFKKLFEYYKSPEKTASSRLGAFVTVGDIGYLDDDGWLYVCDRSADIIISGGANIYPAEVESLFLSHPGIADVAVFGISNEEWGEEVMAVVELRDGYQPSEEQARRLIEFCRSNLAHYKCPKTVEFRDRLPRDQNGKLYKRLLRDEYWPDRRRPAPSVIREDTKEHIDG
jgi:long-chain acyl-CoA synthetase